jgi:hypothetical protein
MKPSRDEERITITSGMYLIIVIQPLWAWLDSTLMPYE